MTHHLYERILGEDWLALPDTTRFLHAPSPVCELVGEADIQRGNNAFSRLLADLMRLPKSGRQIPTRVRVTAEREGEWLERWYDGQRFATWQWAQGKRLLEKFGPFTLRFSLQGNEAGIQFVLERVQLWSIPLPRLMRPHVDAHEASADGKHLFDVELRLPGLGRIVRYSGRLTPAS